MNIYLNCFNILISAWNKLGGREKKNVLNIDIGSKENV